MIKDKKVIGVIIVIIIALLFLSGTININSLQSITSSDNIKESVEEVITITNSGPPSLDYNSVVDENVVIKQEVVNVEEVLKSNEIVFSKIRSFGDLLKFLKSLFQSMTKITRWPYASCNSISDCSSKCSDFATYQTEHTTDEWTCNFNSEAQSYWEAHPYHNNYCECTTRSPIIYDPNDPPDNDCRLNGNDNFKHEGDCSATGIYDYCYYVERCHDGAYIYAKSKIGIDLIKSNGIVIGHKVHYKCVGDKCYYLAQSGWGVDWSCSKSNCDNTRGNQNNKVSRLSSKSDTLFFYYDDIKSFGKCDASKGGCKPYYYILAHDYDSASNGAWTYWSCAKGESWGYVYECGTNVDCDSNEKCSNRQCVAYNFHDHKSCYNGDVYWYDEDNVINEVYDVCDTNEVCIGSSCIININRSINLGMLGVEEILLLEPGDVYEKEFVFDLPIEELDYSNLILDFNMSIKDLGGLFNSSDKLNYKLKFE